MNNKALQKLYNQPHLLGHYLGYNDLTPLHGEWIKYQLTGSLPTVLMAHRNSYKTSAVLVVGLIWLFIFQPNRTVLLLRKTDTKAGQVLTAIAKHFTNGDMYNFYLKYMDIKLSKPRYNANTFDHPLAKHVGIGHSLEAYGMYTDHTGGHHDMVIGDDISTIKDRASKAERDKSKLFVQELFNIVKVGGKLSVQGTPWHKDDIFSLLPEAWKFPIGTVIIRGMDQDYIKNTRSRMTSALYSINYLLEPRDDEGCCFSDTKMIEWDNMQSKKACLDPAFGGNDTTALTIGYSIGDRYYHTGWVWPKDVVDMYDVIEKLLNEYEVTETWVEDNKDEGATSRELGKRIPNVRGFKTHKNKTIKILSYVKTNWPEIFFADTCQDEYLAQIQDWKEGEMDDAVDSLAMLLEMTGVTKIKNIDDVIKIKDYGDNYEV